MGCYTGTSAVNLHGTVCNLQVYVFADILIRAGTAVVLEHDMKINVHFPAVDPCGNLIWKGRQWMEERLLTHIGFITTAFAFLEAAVVKIVKFFGRLLLSVL